MNYRFTPDCLVKGKTVDDVPLYLTDYMGSIAFKKTIEDILSVIDGQIYLLMPYDTELVQKDVGPYSLPCASNFHVVYPLVDVIDKSVVVMHRDNTKKKIAIV